MTPKQVLIKMRELLGSDPSVWTVGALARNSTGHAVSVDDPSATCFCVAGAASKVMGSITSFKVGLFEAIMVRLKATMPSNLSVGLYNDELSYQEMLAWLDRTIAAEG